MTAKKRIENHNDPIKNSRLFKDLSSNDFDCVHEVLAPVIKKYDKEEVIIAQGDVVDKIGIVLSGDILQTKIHHDGSSQIIDLFQKGEIVGTESAFSTFTTSPCFLIANSGCSVAFLSCREMLDSEDISGICKETVWENIANLLSDENIRKMYKINILSKRGLRERILTFLEILTRKRNSTVVDIGMNQGQFAQYLEVNRSSLSKELNCMRKEGLIDYKRNVYTLISLR